MRLRVLAGLGLCAAFASSGLAQSQLNLRLMAWNGGTWQGGITSALPGQTVTVGIFMSGDSGVYGMGGATLRLTGTGGWAGTTASFAAGTSTGRVGPFNFGAATNQIFTTADGFRIDASSDAANNNSNAGMTFFQRDPSSSGATFSTANPALVFSFNVHFGQISGDASFTMTMDQLSRGVASYYTSANDTRPSTAAAALHGITFVVPAPGSCGLLAGAGLLALRRRGR